MPKEQKKTNKGNKAAKGKTAKPKKATAALEGAPAPEVPEAETPETEVGDLIGVEAGPEAGSDLPSLFGAELQSVSEVEVRTEGKAKAEGEPEPQAVPEPGAKLASELEAELESEEKSEMEDEFELHAEPEAAPGLEPESEGELEMEGETELGGEPGLEAEPSPAPQLEGELESEDESESEVEPGLEAGTEPEPGLELESGPEDRIEAESSPTPRPPGKLERLQKILAQAGVASRRHAEELIEQGRVQVNGQLVTELGTKADVTRDHIRVDGKLLQGPERLRYFVLNKPKGFVTTVSDPEGRPTVMQFFEKMPERLYPVGRLDYLSEGLLVVTNDGELANRLTRASSGVEKTYLVKVAGQPTEAELDRLRSGVAIERDEPGSSKVHTSPARIRQVRLGENPWYEVVVVEGRNRELRKMFQEIGHFVEKIRRVGYGPLVLDLEPGKLRELDLTEVELLRKAAAGKLRTPKSKEKRQNAAGVELPTAAPRSAGSSAARVFADRPPAGPKDYRAKGPFAPASIKGGPVRPPSQEFRRTGSGAGGFNAVRPTTPNSTRPAWKRDDRFTRPPTRFATGSTGEGRPAADKTYGAKPVFHRAAQSKPSSPKPTWTKPASSARPPYQRPPLPHRESQGTGGQAPKQPSRHFVQPTQYPNRPGALRPRYDRPASARPASAYSGPPRPGVGHSAAGHPGFARPFRPEGGLARPFSAGSGKTRSGGARPNPRPGATSFRRAGSEGSFTPRGEKKTVWKPKPGFGSQYKPASGAQSKPKPGGLSKSGYQGKPSGGFNRGGSRPSGGRPGGAHGGKKRG